MKARASGDGSEDSPTRQPAAEHSERITHGKPFHASHLPWSPHAADPTASSVRRSIGFVSPVQPACSHEDELASDELLQLALESEQDTAAIALSELQTRQENIRARAS